MLVKRVVLKSDLGHMVMRLWRQAGKTLIASLDYHHPATPPAPAQAEVGCWLPLRVGALPDQGCTEQRPHLLPDDLVLLAAAGPLDNPPQQQSCQMCVPSDT